MQRVSWIFVLLVALMTACSIQIESNEPVVETGKRTDSVAVAFRAYVTRGTSTKAGAVGELTTDSDGSVKLRDAGFGVFGYYGDGTLYDESLKPEFMYNQKVAYDETAGAWSYKPIKFWPNETSGANASGAADRLSFFAYAPHVDVSSSSGIVTGDATSGIVGTVSHATPGDPYVKYIADLVPGKGVDLCWAEPFIDQTKPTSDTRLGFVFNHSLAQLNVQIDTDVDVESHATSSLAGGTHIYVRSVSFTGFTTRGALNLNSPAALPGWHDISGKGMLRREPVTIYDGRSDGYEGMPTGVNPNETPVALNPLIVQSDVATPGVTNSAVNLFDHTSATAPLMVIPIPGVPLTMTIVYDVETADDKMGSVLSDGTTHGLSTEHHISRTIQLSDGRDMILSSGKKYVVNAHLGLVSVKFDASIGDWENATPAEPDIPLAPAVLSSVAFNPDALSVSVDETDVTPPTLVILADDGTPLTLAQMDEKVWSSYDEGVATINRETGIIQPVDTGSTKISVAVTYGNVTMTAEFALTVTSATPSVPLFRGYEVSKGVLKKDEGVYTLTDGNNQFEILDHYKNKDFKYYHQWTQLLADLGGDSDGNIKAYSDGLPGCWSVPDGWSIPRGLELYNIIFGEATDITINGQEVTYGYAWVTAQHGGLDVPSLLLVPDGVEIVCSSLEGKESYFENEYGDYYAFDKILLSSGDCDYLLEKKCIFLPVTGCYIEGLDWRSGLDDYYQEGYYWCRNFSDKEDEEVYILYLDVYIGSVEFANYKIYDYYFPVRLIKKVN